MSPDEIRALTAFALRLADAAAAPVLPRFRSQLAVDNKAGASAFDRFDPVTEADREAERAMRALIHEVHPSHGVLGEEDGYEPGDGALTWVLDPIDGTRGFMTGLPTWGTLIGLREGERPLLGVMSQPFVRERFVGSPLGAALHDRGPDGDERITPLRTRGCASLEAAVLSTTNPDLFPTPAERAAFEELRSRARLVRYGADCYAYCLLAAGLIDLVVESGLQPYDVVAVIPIIEAAGGVITTWQGGPAGDGGRVIAAGDPALHALALDVLRRSE